MDVKFDIDGFDLLFESFHKITGVKIGIFSPEGHCLSLRGGDECAFCRLVKSDEEFLERCRTDDKEAFALAMQGKNKTYRCHAGLYESVAPIMYDNKPVACLMIGQLAPDIPVEKIADELRERLKGHKEIEAIIKSFQDMPARTDEYLSCCTRIMTACAGYIYLNNLVSIERSPLSARFKAYIETNYAENISLKDMASELGVCVTRLCDEIRTECGNSPHAVLKEHRIRKAKELLIKTDFSISEIAVRVGIPDYNYFSRVFKTVTGKTPTQFRKAYR